MHLFVQCDISVFIYVCCFGGAVATFIYKLFSVIFRCRGVVGTMFTIVWGILKFTFLYGY